MTKPTSGLQSHVQAYAELVAAELDDAIAERKARLLWGVLGGMSGALAVMLGGVGLMLWGALPEPPAASASAPVARWLLWATPLPPLALALVALVRLKLHQAKPPFATLKEHLALDLDVLLPKDPA